MSYERLIPENYSPVFKNGLNANLEIENGPRPCVLSGPFALTPETFGKALSHTSNNMLNEEFQDHEYTLLVKNINCCLENNNPARTPCTGKCYWALRNNASGHLVWQQITEETGIGTFHWDGGKRIKMAIATSTQMTIQSGLTALSRVDLAAAERHVPELVASWQTHRAMQTFDALFEHLFLSAYKKIQRDRDGFHYKFFGELMAAPTKQYVAGLIGEPDNVLPGSGENKTQEWRFDDNGKETIYRITFFQDLMSGGTIRTKK